MAKYNIEFKCSASKELKKLPTKQQQRILQKIMSLAENPRPIGSKKLSSREYYRIRQTDYRIVYEIHECLVTVYIVKIGHRASIYDNL